MLSPIVLMQRRSLTGSTTTSSENIDILLLEGIFLFKSAYRDKFDLKVWIDCSFDIALHRAIARGQEGLPPAETKHAFETIYFPAQRLHFERDQPREIADVVFNNDTAL